VAITKDNFLNEMKKNKAGWEICATSSSGKTLCLEMPNVTQPDRIAWAKSIATKYEEHGAKVSLRKRTDVIFPGFKVEVKKKVAKVATKQAATEFGLLLEYKAKGLVTTDYVLHTPSSKEPDELRFMNHVNTFIKKINRPINIELNGIKFENICGVNKVYGTPKADLVLVQFDVDGKRFCEVAFISHKKGGGAKAFQQYGGVSDKAGGGIDKNVLVKAFLTDAAMHVRLCSGAACTYVGTSNVSVFRRLKKTEVGKKLLGQSIFGPDWTQGSKKFGPNNVHCVVQGQAILTKKGSGYNYVLSGEAVHPPIPDWALVGGVASTDPFRAVFAATFRYGRKFVATVDGKTVTVTNMRAAIYPYAFVSRRAARVEI
jgi:hypothetical protein